MPIDIISNSSPSQLNQVTKKANPSDHLLHYLGDDLDVGPAYIVELSAKGRELQKNNPVRIVRL
ncbi:MAG: hypothetical protein E6713_08000 [Sporomusaceae bacterium]|nr:hypothetical protein [Sporomusaceae bacterium]